MPIKSALILKMVTKFRINLNNGNSFNEKQLPRVSVKRALLKCRCMNTESFAKKYRMISKSLISKEFINEDQNTEKKEYLTHKLYFYIQCAVLVILSEPFKSDIKCQH